MTSPMPAAQDAGRDTPQAADEGGNDALEALRAKVGRGEPEAPGHGSG